MSITIRPGTKLSYGLRVRVPLPPVAYFVDSAVGIINEGDTMIFNVSTTAVPDGTVLYWKVENETTTDARFAAVSGSVTVSAGAGSFGITPLADLQTEGTTVFHVTLRTGSIGGTVVWTTGSKAIGDTSLTPPVHGSAVINQPQNDYLSVAQPSYTAGGAGYGAFYGAADQAPIFKGSYPQPQPGWIAIGNSGAGPYQVTLTSVTDGGATWILNWTPQFANNLYKGQNWTLYDPATAPFNLGTTWTVEFWIYMNSGSSGAANQQGGIWGLLNQGGWATKDSINIALSGGYLQINQGYNSSYYNKYVYEPTPLQWVHVAVVNNAGTNKVYYNGIEQVPLPGPDSKDYTASWTNSTRPLFIGCLGRDDNNDTGGGSFDGKITNLRITNTAVYTANFYPPTTLPTKIAGTRLLWTPTDQELATDTSDSASVMTNNGATYSSSYPAVNSTRGSAVFDGSTNRYYRVPGGGHFQLGTTWTIEWWQKSTAATAGTGNIYAVMGQAPNGGRIDIYYQSGNMVVQNGQVLCAEPPAGLWTHVALVNTAGSGTVYYNGVAQSATGNFGNYGQTQDLYIGKRGNNPFQFFNGRLTNIRITDTAVYTGNFTPDQLPAVIAGHHTKLLLRPTVDTIYGIDEAYLGLAVASAGATYTAEYPHILLGLVHPYTGGTLGTIYCLTGDPKLAAFQAIPVGAKITSNISGFGTRTVGITQAGIGIGWAVIYDPTGLTGETSDTDTFNFYWD